jgi:FKBP-type peptidyl-prolyl cis-trans isomerase
MERTSSGLWYQDLAPGLGSTANRGDRVRIHYVGYLSDGTVVDSSLGREAITFELGSGEVIRGWNEGILGMKVGGRRKLVVRPGLGYGSRGQDGVVPPNAVLVFEIQLLDAL